MSIAEGTLLESDGIRRWAVLDGVTDVALFHFGQNYVARNVSANG